MLLVCFLIGKKLRLELGPDLRASTPHTQGRKEQAAKLSWQGYHPSLLSSEIYEYCRSVAAQVYAHAGGGGGGGSGGTPASWCLPSTRRRSFFTQKEEEEEEEEEVVVVGVEEVVVETRK